MNAVVYTEVGHFEIQDISRPTPRPGEVVIRVAACGICQTDLHLLHGEFDAQYPLVPGHELAGTVVELGPDVQNAREGDRVAIDPNVSCGKCRFCLRGLPHFCENHWAYGVHAPGGFAEYVAVLEEQLIKLPDQVSFTAGAMVEPVSCCVHGIDLAGVRPGDCVVILGGGAIGLILAQLAKCCGAAWVMVSEPVARKRELATQLGVDIVTDPVTEKIEDRVRNVTGAGADIVIEAAGRPETAAQAVALCRPGGTALWFGVCPERGTLDLQPYQVFRREVRIQGSFINPFTATRARDLIAARRIRVEPLITERLPLDRFGDGLHALQSAECVKAQVVFDSVQNCMDASRSAVHMPDGG